VVACIAGRRGLVAVADGLPVPSYAFPEAAAHALGRVADYADWRRRPRGGSRPLERTDPEVAQRIVAGARERHHPADPAGGDLLLDATEAADVLAAYGITATGDPQPAGTWSVGVGLAHDALFGPLVTVWWGTDPADAVTAVAQRALPITDVDAAELRAELLGHRPGGAHDQWADPAGGARLDELLERVGRLAEEVPDVAGLQLFPVTDVAGAGVRVLASVRVAADAPRPELAVRRLR
jgi:hypothetical protein